jgi:DNA-3-methyladenine glycosylase II
MHHRDMTEAPFTFTGTVPAVAPFDLRQSLRFMSGFAPCTGEQVIHGDAVRKAFALASGGAAVVEVRPAGGAGTAGVRLTGHAERPLSPADVAALQTAVRRWLSLDDDLTGFLALAADDPALGPVLEVTRGLHQVRFASVAEGATYFVLTQRTAQQVAGARKRRLAAAFGPRVTLDGREWVAFPTLDALAGLDAAALAPFTGNPRQTDYLGHVLRGLHDLGEEFLYTAPYEEALRAVRAIRGVGEFTGGAIMLRALGRTGEAAVFPDLAGHLYGPGATAETVHERYGPYAGWWGYFAKTGLSWLGVSTPNTPARRRGAA